MRSVHLPLKLKSVVNLLRPANHRQRKGKGRLGRRSVKEEKRNARELEMVHGGLVSY